MITDIAFDTIFNNHRICCMIDANTGVITYRDIDSPKALAKSVNIRNVNVSSFKYTLEDFVVSAAIGVLKNRGIY